MLRNVNHLLGRPCAQAPQRLNTIRTQPLLSNALSTSSSSSANDNGTHSFSPSTSHKPDEKADQQLFLKLTDQKLLHSCRTKLQDVDDSIAHVAAQAEALLASPQPDRHASWPTYTLDRRRQLTEAIQLNAGQRWPAGFAALDLHLTDMLLEEYTSAEQRQNSWSAELHAGFRAQSREVLRERLRAEMGAEEAQAERLRLRVAMFKDQVEKLVSVVPESDAARRLRRGERKKAESAAILAEARRKLQAFEPAAPKRLGLVVEPRKSGWGIAAAKREDQSVRMSSYDPSASRAPPDWGWRTEKRKRVRSRRR